jgi:hypothetical protein
MMVLNRFYEEIALDGLKRILGFKYYFKQNEEVLGKTRSME